MAKDLDQQIVDVRLYFKNAEGDLARAIKAGIHGKARELKLRIQRELRRNFRPGPGSNDSFFRAVKIRNLGEDGDLGPASYIRLGVPFMDAFQEGKQISGRGNLIVLLPDGERLGFRRISKGNRWAKVWETIQSRSLLLKVKTGVLVLYRYQGRRVPIYLLTKRVRLKKRLSFYEIAAEIAAGIPAFIAEKLKGG
jgi:hypothetical protein